MLIFVMYLKKIKTFKEFQIKLFLRPQKKKLKRKRSRCMSLLKYMYLHPSIGVGMRRILFDRYAILQRNERS